MPVTLANAAFSCELFLRAILYGFGVDFSKTHGLKGLFEKLPENEQEYISKNIGIKNSQSQTASPKNDIKETKRCQIFLNNLTKYHDILYS